jgi:hypothetical protein
MERAVRVGFADSAMLDIVGSTLWSVWVRSVAGYVLESHLYRV